MGFVVARVIAAALVLAALGRHPYDFYTIMRWVVCGVCVYGAYAEFEQKHQKWGWTFAIIAVLFNPFAIVRLSRATWAPIDVAVGVVLLVSLFMIRPAKGMSR